MENKESQDQKKQKSIWKSKPTLLKDRTTSSGVTFLAERVEVKETRR